MSTESIIVELRSDTFTKPTKEMLEAMVIAEVGDSVYNEDPTMNELEKKIACLFGKEAALFMPSGTMANLIGVLSHCNERGCEVIVGDKSHFNLWEQGGISQVGGVYSRQIPNLSDGTFDLTLLENIIPDHTDPHCARTKVICIENTHNWCGGRVLPPKFIDDLHYICLKRDIKIHLDGSRIMNASIASNQSLIDMCKYCDSINFCFSKGLGAPIGSILIGTREYIDRATRLRKCLGGAMRQTGYLAAACLYGLSHAEENIKLDHKNAKTLAKGINDGSKGIVFVDVENVQTNMVHVKILKENIDIVTFIERLMQIPDDELKELNKSVVVKVNDVDKRTMRLLTNLTVSSKDIEWAIKKFHYVCNEFCEK